MRNGPRLNCMCSRYLIETMQLSGITYAGAMRHQQPQRTAAQKAARSLLVQLLPHGQLTVLLSRPRATQRTPVALRLRRTSLLRPSLLRPASWTCQMTALQMIAPRTTAPQMTAAQSQRAAQILRTAVRMTAPQTPAAANLKSRAAQSLRRASLLVPSPRPIQRTRQAYQAASLRSLAAQNLSQALLLHLAA